MKSKQLKQAIEARRSTRTYQNEPLTSSDIEKISSYLGRPENLVGPFGYQFAIELLIEAEERDKDKIGTYGFIKNPQGYILGTSIIDTKSLFDYAYVLETMILYLTSINIGTCWLGGRFQKQEAMSQMPIKENHIIPAITTLGYPQDKQRLKERMIRSVLQSKKRKPEEQLFFYEAIGRSLGDRAEEFRLALHYVRIGPSAQNKQPWRLVFDTDQTQVHFYVTKPLADHPLYMCEPQYLDIGIAYKHFEVGLEEAGISGELVIDDPNIDNSDGLTYITSWERK
jgi:nitroreductase